MEQSAQRVGVFVDVQNMYYSARALFEQRVDFGEILKEAVGDRQLVRAFAYVIQADKEDEQSFFDALSERGYELRSKELLNFYGGNQKGDWDVGISMDVVRMVPKLDVVVLVSGDGDFAELLKYVKAHGCRAEVIAFGSSASSALREEADSLVDLSKDTNRYLIHKKGGFKRSRSQTTKRRASVPTKRPVSSIDQKQASAQPTTNAQAARPSSGPLNTQHAFRTLRTTSPAPIQKTTANPATVRPTKPSPARPAPARPMTAPTKPAPNRTVPPRRFTAKPAPASTTSARPTPVKPTSSSRPKRIPRITT